MLGQFDGRPDHGSTLTDQDVHQVVDFLASGIELSVLSALIQEIATEYRTQLSMSKKNTGRELSVAVDESPIVDSVPYPLPVLFAEMRAKIAKWKRLSS